MLCNSVGGGIQKTMETNNSFYDPHNYIIGFAKSDHKYACLSNFYPAAFEYAGVNFKNAEQFIMYHKVLMFGRYDFAERIIAEDDPEECKKIARQSFPEFDPDIWEKTCKTIAKRV